MSFNPLTTEHKRELERMFDPLRDELGEIILEVQEELTQWPSNDLIRSRYEREAEIALCRTSFLVSNLLKDRVNVIESDFDQIISAFVTAHNEMISSLEKRSELILKQRLNELEDEIADREYQSRVVRQDLETRIVELEDELATLQFRLNLGAVKGVSVGKDEKVVVVSKYLGERKKHFHSPDCYWAKFIADSAKVALADAEEAWNAGYKPCKTCGGLPGIWTR